MDRLHRLVGSTTLRRSRQWTSAIAVRAHENRDLQHQQYQQAPRQPPALAAHREARCRLASGTQGADAEFPQAALAKAGYGVAWRGQKSWNGVAILGRDCEPIVTRTQLPGDPADTQSRYIEAAVHGVLITSLYAPNGNPQPGPKFAYKLAWMERLATHAEELYGAGIPVVLAGDYNVVPTDRDIYPTQSYAKDALVQSESRALFQRILEQGWVDAIRTLHPDAPMYTFWEYRKKGLIFGAFFRHLLPNCYHFQTQPL